MKSRRIENEVLNTKMCSRSFCRQAATSLFSNFLQNFLFHTKSFFPHIVFLFLISFYLAPFPFFVLHTETHGHQSFNFLCRLVSFSNSLFLFDISMSVLKLFNKYWALVLHGILPKLRLSLIKDFFLNEFLFVLIHFIYTSLAKTSFFFVWRINFLMRSK